jgi:hypothetical protein
MRGEAVPQRMNAETLGDAGTPRCQANDPMQLARTRVLPAVAGASFIVEPNGYRGIEVERLSAGEVAICTFLVAESRRPAERLTCKTQTALVCECFAGCPAFAGKIVDDAGSAPDALSSTLDDTTRVAHNGAEVLVHVGVTPFSRLHGSETADRC